MNNHQDPTALGDGLEVLTADNAFAERYHIEELIGRGGLASVYKARDTVLDETVAVKVYRKTTWNRNLETTVRNEINLSRQIRHKGVLPVYEFGMIDDFHYLITPFVAGETLRCFLARKTVLELKEAVPVFKEIVTAVCAAHSQNVVHRDLKPENIIITEDGSITVIDFGTARISGHDVEKKEFSGTLPYMAPEQKRGKQGDLRSDIYALGVILLEMLKGQKILDIDLDHKYAAADELPADIASVIKGCIAQNPDRRYPSAARLNERIPRIDPAKKKCQRKKYIPAFFISLVSLLIAGAVYLYFSPPFISASSYVNSGRPALAYDRNPATSWISETGSAQWIQFSFLKAVKASNISLIWGNPWPASFEIQTLKNGTWQRIKRITANRGGAQWIPIAADVFKKDQDLYTRHRG